MKVKFNINENVYVKLNEYGIKKWLDYEQTTILHHLPDFIYSFTLEDILSRRNVDGYWKFQLYNLMHIFGEYFSLGSEIPFETDIIFDVELTRQNKIEILLNEDGDVY